MKKDSNNGTAGRKQNDNDQKYMKEIPPDTSVKKKGVTSSFSASTGDTGKYSGEDISDVSGDTGSDEDKIAHR